MMSNSRKRPAFLTAERKIFSIPATKVGNQPGMEVAISEHGIEFKKMGEDWSEPLPFSVLTIERRVTMFLMGDKP